MIYGIGTDIIEINRIARVMQSTHSRFAKRILGPNEYLLYQQRTQCSDKRGLLFLATRFAAKEAFGKAIGLGIKFPITLQNVEILNNENGAPIIQIDEKAQALNDWIKKRHLIFHVSLSDEKNYCIAHVIAEI